MQVTPGFVSLPISATSPRGSISRRTICLCRLKPGAQPSGISVENVSYWWANGRIALQNVSLQVKPGELAMIVGENGCGKSTLLRAVRGLLEPPVGSVSLETPCAFVHQNPDVQIVFPSVGADIAASVPKGPDSTNLEVRQGVLEALEMVGLTPPTDYLRIASHRLSGGQRQRVVVAAALAMKPATILFDEVTASMDPLNKAELLSRVRKIVSDRKIAALWVTHLLEELDMADTVIIMSQGKIVAEGPRVAMMPLVYDLQDAV